MTTTTQVIDRAAYLLNDATFSGGKQVDMAHPSNQAKA